MRVALDATPLLGHPTGIGAFAAGLLRALAGTGEAELVAYGLTWRGRGDLDGWLPDGVRRVGWPIPARPMRAVWVRADFPPVEWWTGPVQVVHGTNFVVPPAQRAAEVATVHDLTPWRFPHLCAADSLAYPELLRRALARGAWLHTLSGWVAGEVVERLGADPARVVTVAPGVPEVAGGAAEEGRRLAGGDRYLLALGAVEPRKDHPTLVRAFDRMAAGRPDLRLVVAGPPAWGTPALEAALRRSASAGRVVRLGWMRPDQRASLLRGATALVFPSLYEGFGFPPLEAMSVGVPVVATEAGSLPEVLGQAALLVPVGDEEALAAAMAAVVDDEEVRARLVEAGRGRAARFSWDACARGVLDLYLRAHRER